MKRLGPLIERAYESGDLERFEQLDAIQTGALEILEAMYAEIDEEGEAPTNWGWYVDQEDEFIADVMNWWRRYLTRERPGWYDSYLPGPEGDAEREQDKGYLVSMLSRAYELEATPDQAVELAGRIYREREALIVRYKEKPQGTAVADAERFLARIRSRR